MQLRRKVLVVGVSVVIGATGTTVTATVPASADTGCNVTVHADGLAYAGYTDANVYFPDDEKETAAGNEAVCLLQTVNRLTSGQVPDPSSALNRAWDAQDVTLGAWKSVARFQSWVNDDPARAGLTTSQKLTPDGVVGPTTWPALRKATALLMNGAAPAPSSGAAPAPAGDPSCPITVENGRATAGYVASDDYYPDDEKETAAGNEAACLLREVSQRTGGAVADPPRVTGPWHAYDKQSPTGSWRSAQSFQQWVDTGTHTADGVPASTYLDPNGIVGPRTWPVLRRVAATLHTRAPVPATSTADACPDGDFCFWQGTDFTGEMESIHADPNAMGTADQLKLLSNIRVDLSAGTYEGRDWNKKINSVRNNTHVPVVLGSVQDFSDGGWYVAKPGVQLPRSPLEVHPDQNPAQSDVSVIAFGCPKGFVCIWPERDFQQAGDMRLIRADTANLGDDPIDRVPASCPTGSWNDCLVSLYNNSSAVIRVYPDVDYRGEHFLTFEPGTALSNAYGFDTFMRSASSIRFGG